MKTRLIIGALTFVGIGATILPASASTLALDFAPTSNSYTSEIVSDAFVQTSALGWQFSLTSIVTITGLAGFDGGSSTNIDHGTGDLIAVYNGSIGTHQSLNASATTSALIASARVGGSTGGTQLNAWVYNTSLTTANNNTLTLGPGNYFILDTFSAVNSPNNMAGAPNSDPKGGVVNQQISTIAGLTWTSEVVCDNNSQCLEPVPAPVGGVQGYGLFGPSFLVSDTILNTDLQTTPLPGALPLLGGGLGVIGLLLRGRKRKIDVAAKAA